MKTKLILLLILFSCQFLRSQNYQSIEEVNDACSQLGFSGDEEAEIAVDKILDQIGVFRNFTIQQCPDINNAVAKNIEIFPGHKERFILYDTDFFNRINNKAANDWAAISILAHEIGHHLNGHALNNQGSNHRFELEADYSSGFYLAKMGATLEEAQSAIQTLKYEKATRTHPSKTDRLKEIKRGWNKAKGITTINTTVDENEETGYEYFRKGEIAFQNLKYKQAIIYFNEAKEFGYVDAYYYLSISYDYGFGVLMNTKESFRLAKIGHELGSVPASFRLGKHKAFGPNMKNKESDRFFKKNYHIKWFKDEFKKSKSPVYAEEISNMYYSGWGGAEKDREIARIWSRQAADLGSPLGEHSVGFFYELDSNNVEAVKWYQKAAEKGLATAQAALSWKYARGEGVTPNVEKRIYWLTLAAEQNYAHAQRYLADIYKEGMGVKKDYDKAVSWYKKAAKNDSKYAQQKLTDMGESW